MVAAVDHVFLVWANPLQLHRGWSGLGLGQSTEKLTVIVNQQVGPSGTGQALFQRDFAQYLQQGGVEHPAPGKRIIEVPSSPNMAFYVEVMDIIQTVHRRLMQDPNASVTIHLKAAAQTTERLLDTLSPGYRKDLEEWVWLIRQWEATQSWNLSPDFVLKRPTDDNFEGSMGSIRAKISE